MEAKKTSQSNLENKRLIFREAGLIIALAVVFLAFESKFYQEEETVTIFPIETTEDVEVLPIFIAQQAARPLPKVTMKPLDVIEIVDNMKELENALDIIDDNNDNTKGSLTGTNTDPIEGYIGDDAEGEVDEFIMVEEMPKFDGNLNKWLNRNLRYPARPAEMGIEGKVFIQFTVEKDGSITRVEAIQSADPDLADEAIRVVKAMPKWIPGKQRHQTVRVRFTIPIVFKLQR